MRKFPTEYHHVFKLTKWSDIPKTFAMENWCNKSISGKWWYAEPAQSFKFAEKSDLILFILRWG